VRGKYEHVLANDICLNDRASKSEHEGRRVLMVEFQRPRRELFGVQDASDARTLDDAGSDRRGYFDRDGAVDREQIILAALVDHPQVPSRSASSSGSTV
jgi:hypothetical protein